MLHVLTNDCHRRQIALQFHLVHRTHFYLFRKLLVQHLTSTIGIIIGHTDRRTILRTCLTHHEHADAVFRQGREDAAVHTNHTYHRQTAHRNQACVVDGRDTLDGASLILRFIHIRDDGSLILGTECVLNENRDIFEAHRVNRRRIDHLRTEVAKLRCLHIRKSLNRVCRIDDTWVGRHEAAHVCPNLQHISIQRSRQNSSCVVRTATSEVRHLARYTVRRDKATADTHILEVLKGFQNQRHTDGIAEQITTLLFLGLNELQRVVPLGTLDERCHDVRADALAIRHNRVARLLTQITNQIHTLVDALQLTQQFVHRRQQHLLLLRVCNDCVNHLVVTLHHLVV